jgi:hypothetical protein
VPSPRSDDHLSSAHYITVILRLMLDPRGHLQHGEIVGVDDRVQRRFMGWRGLTRTLHDWLDERRGGLSTSDQSTQPDHSERS